MIKLKTSLTSFTRLHLLFFVFAFVNDAFGQHPLFKSFDIRSENTKPRIQKLFLDHNGLIWTGTDQGIFTFDGISFNKINGTDTLNQSVSSFFEDRAFNIWVGFEKGRIIQIKNQKINFLQLKDKYLNVSVSAITGDDSNRVYFATKGEGVFCLVNDRLININNRDGLSDDFCYDIIPLPDNRVCVATDAGLSFIGFTDGAVKIEKYGASEGLPDDIVRVLEIQDDNSFLVGMQEKGIIEFDISKKQLKPFTNQMWNYGQVNHIQKVDDKIYVATDEKGIIIVDRDGSVKRLRLEGERNIKANDLLIDIENNLWIAESFHLFRTSGNKMELIKTVAQKQLRFIHCIISDKSGGIWFSPDQQLGHIRFSSDGTMEYKEYKITDEKFDIVSLYFDPYGYLWIGTMGSGIYRFNPENGKVRKITVKGFVENASVLSINGRKDEVWVAGFNSVIKLVIRKNGDSDNATIEKVPEFFDNKLLNDYVYTIFIDSRQRLWFGTDGNGVFYSEGNDLKNIPVPNNAVHSFTEDKKGRIWFSTADEGLQYLNEDNSITRFQTKDGLSDPSPTSLLCDRTGNIIIVHDNGFDVLDPDSKNIVYHSAEENLADINCDLNSITLGPDSTVWMGTEIGILHYDPQADMKIVRPKIIIQSVSVFLDKVDFLSQNKFSSDENNFRFDYDGLWYIDPQRINYFYMLEHFSTKWELTKDHTVSFPKLPSGKYVFRLRASLNENFDLSEETSYSFEILPPLWQRWWFRILAASTIALVVFFIIRRREEGLRKFERLQKEKIEFQFETLKSQVNPHFLFNSFNTLLSIIENAPQNAVEYVERLSEFFRNIVTYRDKNLISIGEELSLLENYIFIQKKRYGENLRISIAIDENTKMKYCIAPLTLQLLAENAIKHNAVSRETPLFIRISESNGRIIVSNNINPKITAEKSAGFGLQNIKSRYELLSKEPVEILQEENNFVVSLPLIRFKA